MANISWMQYCDLFYVEPSFNLFHHFGGNVAPPTNPPLRGHGQRSQRNRVQFRSIVDSLSFNVLLEDEVAILEGVSRQRPRQRSARFSMEDETFMMDEIAVMGSEDLNIKSNDLSEETILRYLKTRIYEAAPTPSREEDRDICVVCQIEYENREILGTLECGHEYHATCIKTWLMQKNLCPLCKRPAIPQEER